MTKPIEQAHRVAISDALSFFVGKTIATLADESGVPVNIVKRIVNEGIERGSLERNGNRYRIENLAPWLSKEPHPSTPTTTPTRTPSTQPTPTPQPTPTAPPAPAPPVTKDHNPQHKCGDPYCDTCEGSRSATALAREHAPKPRRTPAKVRAEIAALLAHGDE